MKFKELKIRYMPMLEGDLIDDEVKDRLSSMVINSEVKGALNNNQMGVLLIVAECISALPSPQDLLAAAVVKRLRPCLSL